MGFGAYCFAQIVAAGCGPLSLFSEPAASSWIFYEMPMPMRALIGMPFGGLPNYKYKDVDANVIRC
jgi:hypothetical protein